MKKKRDLIFLCVTSFIILTVTAVWLCLPTSGTEALAADRDGYENVILKTPDSVTLHGRFIRTPIQKKGTIIRLSGYTADIHGNRDDNLAWLSDAGYDIFEFDYRGSGRAGGSLTLEGLQTDIAAAIEHVLKSADAQGYPVLILGQGLIGAFSVCALANSPYKNSISGLIIDGSFASREDLLDERLKTLVASRPLKEMLRAATDDSYSPVMWIKEISPIPVIIIHGDHDTAIPLESGLDLYVKAQRPKELLIADGKGHEEALTDRKIRKRLISYLDNVK